MQAYKLLHLLVIRVVGNKPQVPNLFVGMRMMQETTRKQSHRKYSGHGMGLEFELQARLEACQVESKTHEHNRIG